MRKITSGNMYRKQFNKKFLGIASLILLMLMSNAVAAPFAYITHPWNNTVSVIDTAKDKVTSTVDVGKYPWGVAVVPDGTKVYVTNSHGGGTVSVIDVAKNMVIKTININSGADGVAATLMKQSICGQPK